MTQYLPSSNGQDGTEPSSPDSGVSAETEVSDLRVFWGPEICRLEYLVHLLDTGRIKDDLLTSVRATP